jgi:hypothetical protein
MTNSIQAHPKKDQPESKFFVSKFEFRGSFGMSSEGDCHEFEVNHNLNSEFLVTFDMSFESSFQIVCQPRPFYAQRKYFKCIKWSSLTDLLKNIHFAGFRMSKTFKNWTKIFHYPRSFSTKDTIFITFYV